MAVNGSGQFRTYKLFDSKIGSKINGAKLLKERSPFEVFADDSDFTKKGTPRLKVRDTRTGEVVEQVPEVVEPVETVLQQLLMMLFLMVNPLQLLAKV
jgi:hypothetical protein